MYLVLLFSHFITHVDLMAYTTADRVFSTPYWIPLFHIRKIQARKNSSSLRLLSTRLNSLWAVPKVFLNV